MRLLVAFVALALCARSAAAERVEHYWAPIIIADLAAVTLIATGSMLDDYPLRTAVSATGVITYFLASPIIHGVHGHGGSVLGSLALRCSPLVSAMIVGSLAKDRDDWTVGFGAGVIAFMVSVPGAMALDAAVLARHEIVVTPIAGFDGGAGLGVAGHW